MAPVDILCKMAEANVNKGSEKCNKVLQIDELLCFLCNNLGKVPKTNLMSVVSNFYEVDEIVAAKKSLFSFADSLQLDGLPRNIIRKAGDNKRRLDVDDIYNLMVQLDQLKVTLPVYVASDLTRIPPINPSEADVCALAVNMGHLRTEISSMASLSSKVDTMMTQFDEFRKFVDEKLTQLPTTVSSSSVQLAAETAAGAQSTSVAGATWSSVAAALRDADDKGTFELVTDKKRNRRASAQHQVLRNQVVPKMFTGAKSAEGNKVVAVPRPLVAFVGRLHLDTTEQDLTEWLAEGGIHDVKCRKLTAKNGHIFKTAAFRVACDQKYSSLFYDESVWPAGCELRDWFFKNNATSATS